MTLNRGSLLKYRARLVNELKALDVVLNLFQGEPKESKKKVILGEVKKRKKSKFTKAQRLAISKRMKEMWARKRKS